MQNKIFITLFIIMCFFIPNKTNAATMSILPNTMNISVGSIVKVQVIINTLNKTINNAEGTIQFPTDMVEIISVVKSSSIFSLWVKETNFSNITGKVTFNGGVLPPGFNGPNGQVVSITFKAKKSGIASVVFADGTIRENDGLGTSITSNLNGATFYITELVFKPTTLKPAPIPVQTTPLTISTFEESKITPDIKYIEKIGNNIFDTAWKLWLFIIILTLVVIDLILHVYSYFIRKDKITKINL